MVKLLPALKNFGITFLISALIFSVVAYFLAGFLTSTVSGILDDENERLDSLFEDLPEDTTVPEEEDPSVIPEVEGDSFTVLFAMTDKRDDVFDYLPEKEEDIKKIETDAEKSVGLLTKDYHTEKIKSIVLVRVSKETGEYSIIPIPSVSKVYTQMGAGYTLLEDLEYFYDKEYFIQKVAAMTGITPDYTFFVNVTEMDDVIKAIGGFACAIPEDIYTDGENYLVKPPEESTTEETSAETEAPDKNAEKDKTDGTAAEEEKVELKKVVSRGNVTIGASNVEAILLFEDYTDGVAERCELHAEFVKGLLGKLSSMDDAALSSVYTALTKKDKIETDMTKEQLLAKGDLIRAYGDFTVTVHEYPGAMSGELFVPDIMDAAKDFLGLRLPADPTKVS